MPNNENENAIKKESKKSKDKKPSITKRLVSWFLELRGEFKKVVWPSGHELFKQTVTVIVTSAIIGLVIIGLDLVFGEAHKLLLQLV